MTLEAMGYLWEIAAVAIIVLTVIVWAREIRSGWRDDGD